MGPVASQAMGPAASQAMGPVATQAMAVGTIAFESLFPLAIFWRRTNPWLLAIGVLFHLSLTILMNVGPFSIVTLCAYPVLLHPQVAHRLWQRRSRGEVP